MNKHCILPVFSLLLLVPGCTRHVPTAEERKQAQHTHTIGLIMNVGACREAIKQNPDDADAHMCVAEDAIGRDNQTAVAELHDVVRIRPNDRKATFLLAQTLVKTGQIAEARELYQQLSTQNDLWGKSATRNLQKLIGR